jgi:prevent-host-death family protein
MKSMSAKDAKNAFGMLLDTARAEPVTIEKHGRPVVVVMSVEEYERLTEKRRESLGRAKSVAAGKKEAG